MMGTALDRVGNGCEMFVTGNLRGYVREKVKNDKTFVFGIPS